MRLSTNDHNIFVNKRLSIIMQLAIKYRQHYIHRLPLTSLPTDYSMN